MKVSKGRSQPKIGAAAFLILYIVLRSPFVYRVLTMTHAWISADFSSEGSIVLQTSKHVLQVPVRLVGFLPKISQRGYPEKDLSVDSPRGFPFGEISPVRFHLLGWLASSMWRVPESETRKEHTSGLGENLCPRMGGSARDPVADDKKKDGQYEIPRCCISQLWCSKSYRAAVQID